MNPASAFRPPLSGSSALRQHSALRQQIGLTLSLLGRDVLAFHPKLSRATGSIPAGLMLSQSLYWTRMLIASNDRGGWFWKTHIDWQREIALSKHEQVTARRRLNTLPFWQEARRETHGRLHYRVDLDALARYLDHDFSGDWSWEDRQQMLLLLGRPLLAFRPLADLCKSVTAAILLSHFLGEERHELRIASTGRRKDWHVHQFETLKQQTSLTRAELNHARKVLRERGYLKERLVGAPPRAEWRFDFTALIRDLRSAVDRRSAPNQASQDNTDRIDTPSGTRVVDQCAGNPQTRLLETRRLENEGIPLLRPVARKRRDQAENNTQPTVSVQLSGIRTTKDPESVQQKIPNPENMLYGNLKVCCTDSGFPNKKLTTGKPTTSTTPTPPSAATAEPVAGGGGPPSIECQTPDPQGSRLSGIVWPTLLLPEERKIAIELLAKVESMAQQILDELAGQHAMAPIRQPLAYIRKLVAQAQAGTFLPSAAPRVAEQRAQQRIEKTQRPTVPHVSNVLDLTSEQREERRQSLARLHAALGRRGIVAKPVSSIPPRAITS